MSNEPNINEIAASVIQGQINNAVGALSKTLGGAVSKILEIINKDLTKYTAAKIRKCSYIRTPIINRDHSTYIYDIYVQTRLKVRKEVVGDDHFIANLTGNDSIVIAGNAGSGKSMFMRYLFLKLCNVKRAKIPLFFELRDINASEKKNLQEFLYYNLIGSSASITEHQFLDSLKAGIFTLILDGFDEINHTDRKEIETQIRKIREQCPELQIIVSSRPDADQRLESWQAFQTVYVEPMDEPQATELIGKIEYDAKIKEMFLREAKGKLFQTHKTFLSNPLLCIMMLVTYGQTGHIPTKRHVFYEKAFDALFSIHDTAKEGVYKRKTYSNLSVDDFRNCMSAFCIVTYLREQFVFTRLQFRESLKQALKLEKLEINIDDLTSDMIESTCLIQIEGTDYVFTHRSFQEYFAAVFISRSPAGGAKVILDRVSMRRTDDVITLAYSINRGLLEREWIIPTLDAVVASPSAANLLNDPFSFIDDNIGGLMMSITDRGPSINFFLTKVGQIVFTICRLFPSTVAFSPFVFEPTRADIEISNSAYNNMALKNDPRLKDDPRRSGQALQKMIQKANTYVQRRITLSPADTEWVTRTTVPSFLDFYVKSLRQLADACRSEAQDQEDILSQLTHERRID